MQCLSFLGEYRTIELINNDTEVIIWGCGPTSVPIVKTLAAIGLTVDFYGDSNPNFKGKLIDGIEVLSQSDMVQHLNSTVIIASFGYVPIYRMLKEIGVKNIYAIRDVFKYSFENIRNDRMILDTYFKQYSSKKSSKVLVELYGNIGDTIIRIGIVKQLIQKYGQCNVYLLFADSKNAELYRIVTDNILVLEEKELYDHSKRVEILQKINELYFSKSFVLCDIRIFAQRRLINHYNCNIEEVIFESELPEDEYLVGIDIDMVSRYLGLANLEKMTAWNELSNYIDLLTGENNIGEMRGKYVAVNIGASRKLRHYDPEKMLIVCKYIIAHGYNIALIGYGNDDEQMAKYFEDNDDIHGHLINFVSKLSIVESTKVLSKASFFVGTDSGLWNISYALGVPSVVLYGGGEYGNFKHPDGVIKYVSVDKQDCFGCKWYCDKTDEYGRAKCVYDILPAHIITAIDELVAEIKMTNTMVE